MKFRQVLWPLCSLLFFSSCKNELKVNAPYKEIPSIYAILNPTETEQMIRINKVFLGEGDANKMAKVSDSVNYAENELEVKLERFLDGKKVQASAFRLNGADSTDIIFTERMIETQPGSFSTSQRVYVTRHKLFETGEYHLTVTNRNTGNIFRAKATSLKPVDLSLFKPLSDLPNYPYPGNSSNDAYIDYSQVNPKPPYEIRYLTNTAYTYQLIIRFHINDSLQGRASEILVDYNAGTKTIRDAQRLNGAGVSFVSHTFTGGGIFTTLGSDMAKRKNDIIGRRVNYLEYIIYSSTLEYSDYMDYIKPSLSINQNKPLYSNFEDAAALGVFTFRSRRSVTKQASTFFLNAIASNPSTCSYKFFNQFLTVSGCK